MVKTDQDPADYIHPLEINGLSGRMLRLPDTRKKGREILFVYGQHSSLERWWGMSQEFNRYGAFTMPDLPGFGDMTSLYKIGLEGSIDNLADYLAAFIKLRYKGKKVSIFGMSFGFAVVTRMLQKYPDLNKRVELLVSIMGLAHKDDFIFPLWRRRFYACTAWVLSKRLSAFIFKTLFLNPPYLRRVYKHSRFAKEKFANMSGDEFKRTMDMELLLWKINDVRTQMRTNFEMMTLDNTKKRIDLPMVHIASDEDRYFDHLKVEQHLKMIFNDFQAFYIDNPNHAPTIVADAKDAAPFIPKELRRILNTKKRPAAKK